MMLPRKRIPTHPGEILSEEFLKPLGVTQVALGRGGSAAREQRRHARRAARDERCTGEWTLLPCASCATPAPSPAGGTSSIGTTAGDCVSEPRADSAIGRLMLTTERRARTTSCPRGPGAQNDTSGLPRTRR